MAENRYLWGFQGGGEEEEKSLTGETSKALITAYYLVLSEKIKICGEENLVLQEQFVLFELNNQYCI